MAGAAAGASAAAAMATNPLMMLSNGQPPWPWPSSSNKSNAIYGMTVNGEEMAGAVEAIDAIDMFADANMENELVAAGAVQGQNRDLVHSLVTFLIGTIAFQFQRTIDDSSHQLGIVIMFLLAYQVSARLESLLRTLLARPSFGRPALADYIMFTTRNAAAFVGFVSMSILRANIMPSDGGFRLLDVVPVAIFLLLLLAELMFEQIHLTAASTLYKQAATLVSNSNGAGEQRQS